MNYANSSNNNNNNNNSNSDNNIMIIILQMCIMTVDVFQVSFFEALIRVGSIPEGSLWVPW